MYASSRSTRRSTPGSSLLGAERRSGPDRLLQWALASLVAGLAVAGLRTVVTFDHGIWLVAYLLLVGFLAPLALGTGQAALREGRAGPGRTDAQALFWAFGTVAVPAGVFADSRLIVILGGAALLIALRWIAAPALEAQARSRMAALAYAHLGLVAFMAASVVVGVSFAWGTPWY